VEIKFVVVSKDTSFKMMKDKFDTANGLASIDVEYVENNVDGLPMVYNKFLADERQTKKHDYLVLMHADVSFNARSFIEHLSRVGNKYGIIGLCGTSTLNVSQSPLNWWTGSNPTPYEKWGCVTHGELGDQTSYFSEHSPNVTDAEVACIDGLCIVFTRRALETDLSFDESLGKFDFYDTDISCQAVMKYKLKLGVMVQKDLCHYSVGRSILTPSFLDTELKFRSKWNFPVPKDSALEKHIEMKKQFASNMQSAV
jgi:hypothetical protein